MEQIIFVHHVSIVCVIFNTDAYSIVLSIKWGIDNIIIGLIYGTFRSWSIPQPVELVLDHGHEIGCHGYDHSHEKAFDVMSFHEQAAELRKAKGVIETIAGTVRDFRASALRINESSIRALEETGFNTDSSIASQRFDGPLTFGSMRKLKWLAAIVFSYIGTTMRVSTLILRYMEKVLFANSIMTERPLVFLFHPNECLDANSNVYSQEIPDKNE